METIESSLSKLAGLYTIELYKDCKKSPEKYMDTPETIHLTAAKMILAFQRGTGNINSNPLRRSCRKLGIPFRIKEISKAMGAK